MTDQAHINRIHNLGTDCALEAIEAASGTFFADDGTRLIPTAPKAGDFDALRDEIGREPSSEDLEVFETAYSDAMPSIEHPA